MTITSRPVSLSLSFSLLFVYWGRSLSIIGVDLRWRSLDTNGQKMLVLLAPCLFLSPKQSKREKTLCSVIPKTSTTAQTLGITKKKYEKKRAHVIIFPCQGLFPSSGELLAVSLKRKIGQYEKLRKSTWSIYLQVSRNIKKGALSRRRPTFCVSLLIYTTIWLPGKEKKTFFLCL